MFKRTGVFAVAVILALGLVWSEFMTSLILVHNGTATGQGTLVPVRTLLAKCYMIRWPSWVRAEMRVGAGRIPLQ